MLFPTDTHQQEKPSRLPPPPPPPLPNHPASDTPQSDSGRSFSSSDSSSIMGTPFDLGAQRFEYPFPPAQGSPTDPFLPLSSSIPSHSHAQLPPWPIHISKSFPLTQPPLGKAKAHPKLRSANVREPPVPPGLVKRRSRIAGVKHQSSSEEPSDKSDASDGITRARRSARFLLGLTEATPRNSLQLDNSSSGRSEIVPLKQAASLPTGSFDRPSVEGPAMLAMNDANLAERMPRPPVRERNVNRAREEMYSFTVYCWLVASQLRRFYLPEEIR